MGTRVEPFYAGLGLRIGELRNSLTLSQEKLGRMLEPQMTRASIANIEAGKQRVLAHTLLQLAAALGVEVTELVRDVSVEHSVMHSELASKLSLNPAKLKALTLKLQQVDQGK